MAGEFAHTPIVLSRGSKFSLSEQDLGRTNLTKHHIYIDTGNAGPIKQHPRRTSPAKRVEIERQVEDLLQREIGKKSSNPWSSPVVLEDGFQRFCVKKHASECGNYQGCLSAATH